MFAIFSLLSGVGSLFMLAIIARVTLSWFSGPALGEPQRLLGKVTDPYLNWFRGIPGLRTGGFDWSPVAALLALSLAVNVLGTLGAAGRISVGAILAMLLSGVWGAASFALFLLAVVVGAQLLLAPRSGVLPPAVGQALESVSRPVVRQVNRFVFRDRLVHYKTGLITSLTLLVGGNLIGGLIVGAVSGILRKLPF
jgi:YggT family protein